MKTAYYYITILTYTGITKLVKCSLTYDVFKANIDFNIPSQDEAYTIIGYSDVVETSTGFMSITDFYAQSGINVAVDVFQEFYKQLTPAEHIHLQRNFPLAYSEGYLKDISLFRQSGVVSNIVKREAVVQYDLGVWNPDGSENFVNQWRAWQMSTDGKILSCGGFYTTDNWATSTNLSPEFNLYEAHHFPAEITRPAPNKFEITFNEGVTNYTGTLQLVHVETGIRFECDVVLDT